MLCRSEYLFDTPIRTFLVLVSSSFTAVSARYFSIAFTVTFRCLAPERPSPREFKVVLCIYAFAGFWRLAATCEVVPALGLLRCRTS
jgi:hypothetical protein